MNRIDVKNAQFHRKCVSKRLAVKCIETVAEIVEPYGVNSLYSSHYGNWDYGLKSMMYKIRQMKIDAGKYHKLQAILKQTVN